MRIEVTKSRLYKLYWLRLKCDHPGRASQVIGSHVISLKLHRIWLNYTLTSENVYSLKTVVLHYRLR
jgi:hypothetical protein